MKPSMKNASAAANVARPRLYGVGARRIVGGAILFSGTLIFAAEVHSHAVAPLNPAAMGALPQAPALASN